MRQRILLELLARPQESFLARLFDAAPIGVSATLDGRIAYANPICATMWGFARPHEMHGVSFFGLIAPESRAFVERLWRARSGDAEEPWVYELVGLRSHGEPFPYRCSSLSYEIEGGRKATLAFFEELGEERSAEAALRAKCAELLERLGE